MKIPSNLLNLIHGGGSGGGDRPDPPSAKDEEKSLIIGKVAGTEGKDTTDPSDPTKTTAP